MYVSDDEGGCCGSTVDDADLMRITCELLSRLPTLHCPRLKIIHQRLSHAKTSSSRDFMVGMTEVHK